MPEVVQKQIEATVHEAHGTQVAYFDLGKEHYNLPVYMARYTVNGKRMEIQIGEDGKVLHKGETLAQRRKDQKARLESAKNAQERAQIEKEVAAERDQHDRELIQQYAAAQAAPAQPAAAHAPGNPIPSTPGVPAVPGTAYTHIGESAKMMSEEYNSNNRKELTVSQLPPGVKKTFDMETLGCKNINYYEYSVDGRDFFSAHYDIGGGERDICRVDPTGKLLGKNELTGSADAADEAAAGHTGAPARSGK